MSDSPLSVKSKALALEIIKACRILRENKCESAIINQVLRSGTSVGANVRESFYAQSKADFISKLHIALKECAEAEFWLEILVESEYLPDPGVLELCTEVKRILIASLNTTKQSAK